MSQKRPPKFCWGCGAEIKESQKFCTRCGKPVSQKKEDVASQTNPQASASNTAPYQLYGNPQYTAPTQPTNQNIGIPTVQGFNQPRNIPIESDQTVIVSPTSDKRNFTSTKALQKSGDLDPKIYQRLDTLEEKIDDLNVSKKLEKVEFKLNALFGELHFDDQLKELTKKVIDESPKNEIQKISNQLEKQQEIIDEKLTKLATAEDLQKIQLKFDGLNTSALDNRLQSIESKISNINSDEKLANLAKNTVDRLNSIEQRLEAFKIEDRQRLIKLDEKLDQFDNKLQNMNNALATLVPSLVKLTEKVNQLQLSSSQSDIKEKSEKTKQIEHSKKPALDLPPFPGVSVSNYNRNQKNMTIESATDENTDTSAEEKNQNSKKLVSN